MTKSYRVHVHDHNDQGTWLASADFNSRPMSDEVSAALPALRVPGRYEVRVCVVQGGNEYLLSCWLQDAAPERVIFRRWFRKQDGTSVIALFPDMTELGTGRAGMVTSFEHHGQHGAASLGGVIDRTRPAKPDEYADLKRELEAPPYRYKLAVIQRTPRATNQPFNLMSRTADCGICGGPPHTDNDHC